jgi:hypothetical protein
LRKNIAATAAPESDDTSVTAAALSVMTSWTSFPAVT